MIAQSFWDRWLRRTPAWVKTGIRNSLTFVVPAVALYGALLVANRWGEHLWGHWTVLTYVETWPCLRGLDPRGRLLDDPARLLSLAADYEATTAPLDERVDRSIATRHEAVRALLALQERSFRVRLPRPQQTTGLDHFTVGRRPASRPGVVRLVATPSKFPDTPDMPGDPPTHGYWKAEVLEFTPQGQLLSRSPYVPTDEGE
jgi:hypothetical protein